MPKLPLNEFIRLTESNSLISTLTKRELFAVMAMMGITAKAYDSKAYFDPTVVAELSVQFADALIEELNK